MSTPHNEANLGDIAKTVIMPGDPLRAKHITEKFLDNCKLVNQVRNIYAYTGEYKGKEITVMASGMGMPSMGIYSFELFKFYDVENIIRIGSCGAYVPDLNLFDIVLSKSVFTESTYALGFNNDDCHLIETSKELNEIIKETATENHVKLIEGDTICNDSFDPYMTQEDFDKFMDRVHKQNFYPLSAEMEAFALCYNAKILNKKATCLMTVVDSRFETKAATSEEREQGLDKMIKLALDASLKC